MTDRKIIEELVQQELKEANEKHPLFHSPHEAYAVIKEELEELIDEVKSVCATSDNIWGLVKNDIPIMCELRAMKTYAEFAAAEAIQVAAMCQKAIESEV